MNDIRRLLFVPVIVAFLGFSAGAQGLLINELMSTNSNTIFDEDDDSPDWIEIYNSGNSELDLSDYFLSDDPDVLAKWQFPAYKLAPSDHFLVFASGKDRQQVPLHWKTIVNAGASWKYLIPVSEPSSTWKQASFNDASWKTGQSGFGFGDGDDKTILPGGTVSVFLRIKFSVNDPEKIRSMILHMDYDDGFVAYLNNTEIARAGLGSAGTTVAFNQFSSSHEALIYQGKEPESFDLEPFIYLLKATDNVLAIQVHNATQNSSDMTAIPILTLGSTEPFENGAVVSEYVHPPVLYPHTSFKLSSTGETVYLSGRSGTIIDSVRYEMIPSGLSYGRSATALQNWGFFLNPTPGNPNGGEILNGLVTSEVQFSIHNMFLNSPTQLTLSGAGPGEEIRFTLDGTDPTGASEVYRNPVLIDKNTPVRARIFQAGKVPGKITSRTYLFDQKPTLPVFSIVTAPENLWDNETGIYVLGDEYENQNPYFGANFWEDWEKPAAIEMTGTDGAQVFSLNCGIKIFGAWSRARDQKSLAIFFRKEYGDPVLENIQLFRNKNITEFKSLVLRNAGNDYDYTRFRDGMMTSLAGKLDNDYAEMEPAIVYINGEYWGHMNLREKINEDYLESNHGVNASEIDLLELNGNVLEGSADDYRALVDFISTHNLAVDNNYEFVASKIDISNFIDYFISEIFFDNRDWPGNNIKYWKPQGEGGKWRWIMFDTDFGFGLYNNTAYLLNTFEFATEPNGPDWPNPPWSTLFLRKLLANGKFRVAFVNRFADVMNTTFLPQQVIQRIDSMAAIIEPEIERHAQRWGVPNIYYWRQATETMRVFARNRPYYIRGHIKSMYNSPAYHNLTLSTLPTNSGTVKLNTIHVTRFPWTGQYFKNYPVQLTAHALKGYRFHHWQVNGQVMPEESITLDLSQATSAQAVFEASEDDGKTIVINEINYNSADESDAGDWVELFNYGKQDIDISGWVFRDNDDAHQFVIPGNTVLKSNGYIVLCRDSSEFLAVHPGVSNFIGEMDFGLSGTGDAARLFDNLGLLIDSLTYGVELPWPAEPNGTGRTLELRHFTYDNAEAASWKASVSALGTPGRENSVTTSVENFAGNVPELNLKVYPNPFTTETRIEINNNSGFEPAKISIFTLDGRLVYQRSEYSGQFIWKGENSNGERVQPGIYICRAESGSRVFTAKIMLHKR